MENKNNKFNKNFNKNNYNKNESEVIEEAVEEVIEETTVESELVKVIEEPVIVEEKKTENEIVEGSIISKEDLSNLINKKSKYLEAKKEDMAPIDYQELSDELIELRELYDKLYGNKSKSNVIQVTNAPLIKNRPKIKNSRFSSNSMLL